MVYLLGARLGGYGQLGHLPADELVSWVPFQRQFHASFTLMVTDIVEQFALYAAITLLSLLLTRGRGRGTALLLLLGVLGLTEAAAAVLVGRAADITPLLLALAAWQATTRAWELVRPRRVESPQPVADPRRA